MAATISRESRFFLFICVLLLVFSRRRLVFAPLMYIDLHQAVQGTGIRGTKKEVILNKDDHKRKP